MSQHEDPDGQASIALAKAMLAMKHGPGGRFSGAQIVGFERGWAIPAFRHGDAVHYLRIAGELLIAACGGRFPLPRVKGQGVVLFGQGDFRRCRKCQRAVDRRQGAG